MALKSKAVKSEKKNMFGHHSISTAICDLTRVVRELGREQNNKQAILDRMDKMERNIMSALSDFLAKQQAFNARQESATAALTTSLTGITEDVQTLNEKITELQNSNGTVTPEDQLLIDSLVAQGDALSTKTEGLATALEALNALTPPKVPVTP